MLVPRLRGSYRAKYQGKLVNLRYAKADSVGGVSLFRANHWPASERGSHGVFQLAGLLLRAIGRWNETLQANTFD